jgi:hypothetical protein
MSEEFDFEAMQFAVATMSAALDQMIEAFRPTMKALATVEQACIAAGMSERTAAVYTMKVADGFGWPPMGVPA